MDPNELAAEGKLPLCEAVLKGRTKMVKALMDGGARIDTRCCFSNWCDEAQEANPPYLPVHVATVENHHDVLRQLLGEYGADVNAETVSGATPLTLACTSAGHADTLRILLDAGADMGVTVPGFGCTPLHLASMGGHTRHAAILLERGAAPNAVSKGVRFPGEGWTPAMFAAESGVFLSLIHI